MTEGCRQVRNTFIYLAPPLIGNALSLLSLTILTRFLSKDDFGVWALSQAYAFFVTGIANLGLNIGYERNFFECKDPSRSAGLLYSTLLFVLGMLITGGIATFLFRDPIAAFITGSSSHANVLFWSYCVAGIAILKLYYLTFLKNSENAKAYAWYTIDESILGTLFSLLLVACLQVGIIGLVWGQLVAGVLVLSVLCVKITRQLPVGFDKEAFRDCLKISLPLTPRILFGIIGGHFDKYMLRLLDTVGGAGIYSLGQRVSNVVFVFMTSIQNVYSPQVYKRMFDMGTEGGASVGRYLTPYLYASVAAGLLLGLFAEEVIILLMPVSYHDTIEVVMIMCMLYVFYFFGKQPQLIFAKKTLITSFLTLIGIALNIAINIPFIRMWGVTGAAWGTLLAGLVTVIVTFAVSQKYYFISWEYGKILPMLGLFLVSMIVLILMRYYQVPYGLRLTMKVAVLAGYVYLGVSSRILNKSSVATFKGAFVR